MTRIIRWKAWFTSYRGYDALFPSLFKRPIADNDLDGKWW